MLHTFEELRQIVNGNRVNKEVTKMGQELNRDIVEQLKNLDPSQFDIRKELNKERIKALGMFFIQGGKA